MTGIVNVPGKNADANNSGTMSAADKTKLDDLQNYEHPTVTAADSTSKVNPVYGGTFTAVDSVARDTMGHVTGVNTKTVILPTTTEYSHPTITRADTTSNETAEHSGTVDVVDSVSTDSMGHVSGVNTKTVTMPEQYEHPTASTKETDGTSVTLSIPGGNVTSVALGAVQTIGYDEYGHVKTIETNTLTINTGSVLSTSGGGTGNTEGKAVSAETADSADSATKLTKARNIDGISFDGSDDVVHYAVCNDDTDSGDKYITVNNFSFTEGARLRVKFSNETAPLESLTVNNTYIQIKAANAGKIVPTIPAGSIVEMVYDGEYFIVTNVGTDGNLPEPHGLYSHAEGNACVTGPYAEAAHVEGGGTEAFDSYCHSEGQRTRSGSSDYPAGYANGAHAEGIFTVALGLAAHAEGCGCSDTDNGEPMNGAEANYAHAEGLETYVTGEAGHAEGNGSQATGDYSHAEGLRSIASGYAAHAEGTGLYNKNLGSSSQTAASGSYSHTEGYMCNASGEAAHAEGNGTTASADYSHAEGQGTTASYGDAHAEGWNTTASYTACHAEGYGTEASGSHCHAEGYQTIASSSAAHAEGSKTKASSNYTHAEGLGTYAASLGCHVGGKYNDIVNNCTSESSQTGDVMIIGNGTSSDNVSNALRVTYDGSVYGQSAFNSSGADYAEFVKEWADGNPDGEDRIGYFVTIKNGLLEKANADDYILGITSGNPSIIGNSDETYYWRYERDEFNRIIWEEITDDKGNTGMVMKQSEDYDPTQKYIARKDRPEWDYVGMLGVIPVRDDGTCIAGEFCTIADGGIATHSDTPGWMVVERKSDNVVAVVFK